MLHLDFESRSTVDLKSEGVYRYWNHPLTEVTMACWAIDDGPVHTWWPGDPCPQELRQWVRDGGMVAAHNAAFERLAWWKCMIPKHRWPEIPLDQFYCTAALARARGFPGALDKASRFGKLPFQKNMGGHALMMKLCKPRGYADSDVNQPLWHEDPEDLLEESKYCAQDVETERALTKYLIPLSKEELRDYHISERINDRGIFVDLELARAATISSDIEKLAAAETLTRLTDGAVTAHTQVARILDWLASRGVHLANLNKGTIEETLEDFELTDEEIQVLEIRRDNAKAAVTKFAAMLNRQIEGRVQGLFMFRGAGQTGRYSSTGVQVHNLVRDSSPQAIPILKKRGLDGLRMLGDPVALLSQMVRPAFIPAPGHSFLIGDYAAIEARIAAWLAGATTLLERFAKRQDVYCDFASRAYHKVITKKENPTERFIGKGCILGLGFGGAEGALARSLAQGKVFLPPEELRVLIDLYRKDYAPEIPVYWRALDDAAMLAMRQPGRMGVAGRISYLFDGTHLWCKLPSGRLMCYPFAEVVEGEYGPAIEYRRGNRSPKKDDPRWPTVQLWYGMLMENCCQGIAFDLLSGALRELHKDVRIHVHDEIVVEVPTEKAGRELPKFKATMEQVPDWAEGLPIEVEAKIEQRYVK